MEGEQRKTGFGGWLFLLLVVATYGVIAVMDAELARQALSFFGGVMRKVLPALVLMFVLLLAVDLLLEPQWIKRNLGKASGIKGWLLAAVGGILATGPIYAWYALLREFREKGMRTSLIATFLYSRAVKLPLLPLMIHYFGAAYTLVICLYMFGFSILTGVLIGKLEDQKIL